MDGGDERPNRRSVMMSVEMAFCKHTNHSPFPFPFPFPFALTQTPKSRKRMRCCEGQCFSLQVTPLERFNRNWIKRKKRPSEDHTHRVCDTLDPDKSACLENNITPDGSCQSDHHPITFCRMSEHCCVFPSGAEHSTVLSALVHTTRRPTLTVHRRLQHPHHVETDCSRRR